MARAMPGVGHTVGVSGMSILLQANAPNFGSMFVILEAVRRAARAASCATRPSPPSCGKLCYKEIPEAVVSVFGAPPVDGLGTAGGFKLMVEDRGDLGLARAADRRPTR